jgi:hypothetical protein
MPSLLRTAILTLNVAMLVVIALTGPKAPLMEPSDEDEIQALAV